MKLFCRNIVIKDGTAEMSGGWKLKDTEILDLYFQRDQRALAETQKAYGNYCYSIAWRILNDKEDAEECVNDTWLKAWNAIPPSRPMRLSLFLGTITRNLSLDRWKGKKAMKRGRGETQVALEELSECIPNNDCTEDAVEAAELERLLTVLLTNGSFPVIRRAGKLGTGVLGYRLVVHHFFEVACLRGFFLVLFLAASGKLSYSL